MKTLTYLCLFIIFYVTNQQGLKFYVIRQWKYVNFTWPDEDTLKSAIASGGYIPENNIISGVKYHNDYFYITLPRMKPGVPATLVRIKAGPVKEKSPSFEPYPSWEMNAVGDCNNLQNVQNIEIDTKAQIWIIDGGKVQTSVNPIVKCPPKLVIYDIEMERVNTVYLFPEEVASKNGSFLYDLVVDNTDGGYAYITDNSAHDPGIIVFSVKENRSWKIRSNKTMMADPSAVQFTIKEININSPLNIAGIALGPKIHTSNDQVVVNEDREVYFCPISSHHLYSINTTILRNEHLAHSGANLDASIKDIGLKASQTGAMIMDNQGILYYSLLGNSGIARWDSHTPFQSGQRLIAQDETYLEWPNSFTFDNNGNLTVLVNSMDRFIFGKFDLNENNFRLISSHVGGKSYLYDSHEHTSPEPEPEPSHDHEHDHQTSPKPDNDHNHEHDHNQRTDSEVTVTPSSSSKVALTLPLFFSIFIILVKF